MGCTDNFKDLSFLLKFIAMILAIVSVVLWTMGSSLTYGMETHWQVVVFSHTVPAYMIILVVTITLYCLDEQPGQWYHRLFFITGIILYLITGIVGLLNCLTNGKVHSSHAMLIAIFNIVNGVLLLVDTLKVEGIF